MQRERRRDPYPWHWELPLATTASLVTLILAGVHLGRSAANLVAGAGWTWPHSTAGTGHGTWSPFGPEFWSSLAGVLGGDSAAGLHGQPTTGLAGPGLLWTSVAVTEAAVLALTGWAGIAIYSRWGPGRMRGMATAAEAEKLLGVTRLRRVAPVVRPDRYGKRGRARLVAPVTRPPAPGEPEPASTPSVSGRSGPWLRAGRSAGRGGVPR